MTLRIRVKVAPKTGFCQEEAGDFGVSVYHLDMNSRFREPLIKSVLYQGTTLVVPQVQQNERGL